MMAGENGDGRELIQTTEKAGNTEKKRERKIIKEKKVRGVGETRGTAKHKQVIEKHKTEKSKDKMKNKKHDEWEGKQHGEREREKQKEAQVGQKAPIHSL